MPRPYHWSWHLTAEHRPRPEGIHAGAVDAGGTKPTDLDRAPPRAPSRRERKCRREDRIDAPGRTPSSVDRRRGSRRRRGGHGRDAGRPGLELIVWTHWDP